MPDTGDEGMEAANHIAMYIPMQQYCIFYTCTPDLKYNKENVVFQHHLILSFFFSLNRAMLFLSNTVRVICCCIYSVLDFYKSLLFLISYFLGM